MKSTQLPGSWGKVEAAGATADAVFAIEDMVLYRVPDDASRCG
jgi:hypothetical protein